MFKGAGANALRTVGSALVLVPMIRSRLSWGLSEQVLFLLYTARWPCSASLGLDRVKSKTSFRQQFLQISVVQCTCRFLSYCMILCRTFSCLSSRIVQDFACGMHSVI